jgi:hypothetical protein
MKLGTIKAFFNLVSAYFKFAKAGKEHAAEISTVKDRKALKKATDIAEKIMSITDRYSEGFSKQDLKKYEKLKEQFKKVN